MNFYTSYLEDFYQVEWLDHTLFKISAWGAPPISAFELETDLTEWDLNKSRFNFSLFKYLF